MTHMTASLIQPVAFPVMQPVASSLINAITGKGVMRAGKGQKGGFFPLLTLPLIMKVLGKGVTRTGRGYNIINQKDRNF